jgi:serine/threonine protein kinase
LNNIVNGLDEIHKKQMVHRDFHIGNILFNNPFVEKYANKIYISDMGLCGKVGDINQNNVYGVMPYVAPEVLRSKPYTQAADIYSFGMIMYFVATGRQPFDNCAHDHLLALDICNGIRPEINEPEAPDCYINLMKKCWNSNPENRPNITELKKSLWSITTRRSGIEKAENYRKSYLSSLKGDISQITTHPQAVYTSRLLNSFTENLPKNDSYSDCLDCLVTNNFN